MSAMKDPVQVLIDGRFGDLSTDEMPPEYAEAQSRAAALGKEIGALLLSMDKWHLLEEYEQLTCEMERIAEDYTYRIGLQDGLSLATGGPGRRLQNSAD